MPPSNKEQDVETEFSESLKYQLRNWVCKHNVTSNSVTDLLHILNPVLNYLPLSHRTLMETPRTTSTVEIKNGKILYFGLRQKILFRTNQVLRSSLLIMTLFKTLFHHLYLCILIC